MKLNAEQLMKALECCITQGAECRKCPFMHTQDLCYREIKRKALALIKQLTEDVEWSAKRILEADKKIAGLTAENADLKAIAEGYQKQFEDCYEEKAKLTEENERLRAIPEQLHKEMSERMVEERKIERKLAVRQMQERLKVKMNDLSRKEGIFDTYYLVSKSFIDQIAKEMSEGNGD